MKIFSPLVVLFASCTLVFPSLCAGTDLSSLDTTLRVLQEQTARQIERIQSVRQRADSQVTVARVRMEEQLKRAMEELAVQTEVLERLQEQLQDKTKETDEKLASWREQATSAITNTLAEISVQMGQTTDLMRRLEQLKSQASDCPDTGNATVAPSSSQTVPSAGTSSAVLPQPAPSSQLLSPPMETVAFVPPEPTPLSFEGPAPSG